MKSVARVVAAVILVLHVVVGIAALVLLPRGFSAFDPKTWSNMVIPAIGIVLVLPALARWGISSKPAPLAFVTAMAAGGWLAAVGLGVALFPQSIGIARWAPALSIAFALVGIGWMVRERAGASVVGASVGGVLGAIVIAAQRAPAPSTMPAGGAIHEVRGTAGNEEAASGHLTSKCGKGTLHVNPHLTFHSRSPDRTWSLLAPPDGRRRQLSRFEKTKTGFRAVYKDEGEEYSVTATRDPKVNVLDIEAIAKLDTPVYSHLNTFTSLRLEVEASIAFGPTGNARFDILAPDSPEGKRMKLATLAHDRSFRVVQASDAEKGPFTELAVGTMKRDEPLVIELRPKEAEEKGADKGCKISLQDWASQLSTEPSPTAGYGLAQNSIQFFRRGKESIVLFMLAETGPGRGWDTVGHTAGVYRNRIHVEPFK